MPGVASVKWSEENMAKALLALIGYGCVKVNNEEAQKVAAHLGGGCTTSAIKSLISTRKSAFKVVPIPVVDKNEVPLVAKKRNAKNPPSKPTKVRKITKKVKKAIYDADDGEGDDGGDGDDNEDVGLVTPPFSGIKRESPRQAAFVKYECEDGGLDGILDEEKAGKVSSSSENGSDDGEFDPFA